MTGGRCHRPRKMRGRGTDGGCGTEEKPCSISGALAKISAKQPSNCEDFYTQARKVLSERSPFDTEDAQVSTAPTLPSGLANLLSKHSDSRKRHKKSHLGSEAKSSRPGVTEKARGSNIWAETEEYFRELTVDDIERLHGGSSSGLSASGRFFSILVLENGFWDNGRSDDVGNCIDENGDCEVVVEDEVEKEIEEELMEVDSVGANILPQEDKGFSSSQSSTLCSGLEWLLGSRSKIYLTSERPSKKRKFLGGAAGLEKLLVACPVNESSSLCHYCGRGDSGDQLNRLIVCNSCSVAVHQRCYGVQDDFADFWLCSWCKQRNEVLGTERPCLLCPRQGGALKPVCRRGFGSENGGGMEYAHLFCCQWMPEVYIEDTRAMEPVMNVEGIKETRKKLICYLCKVKFGACVRCSNGACRTSFHPICAREARHRMEIWGKFGCDDVELRAFCSKHSDVSKSSGSHQVEDLSVAVGSDSHVFNHEVASTVNKPHKLKIGRRNRDKLAVHVETTNIDSDKFYNNTLHGEVLVDTRSNHSLQSDYLDVQQPVNKDTMEIESVEGVNFSHPLNRVQILKKDACLSPVLQSKAVGWPRNDSHVNNSQKNLKVKINSSILHKDETGVADDSDAVTVSESDIADVVSVKSLPPRRRTKSSIRILKDNKVICSSKEVVTDDEIEVDEVKSGQHVTAVQDCPIKESVPHASAKISSEPVWTLDILTSTSKHEGDCANPSNCNLVEDHQADEAIVSVPSTKGNPICSFAIPTLIDSEAISRSYVHPLIQIKFMQIENGVLSSSRGREVSQFEATSSSGICCNQQSQYSSSTTMSSKYDGENAEQLDGDTNRGILELSPADEVEGELIFYQHRLLCNAVARKRFTDDLICKIVKSLPREIDAAGKQKWDAVLVNLYLGDLKEAKKLGRKERRHKEAQAVLAAATAAAAASSRISSFRKDNYDESACQEDNRLKMNASGGRAGLYSQQMPRAKETLSRLAVSRVSSDKNIDFVQLISDFSKEDPRTCDICRRFETILNPILVCSSCKVAVHLDCYRSVKESTGPWFCELCEDFVSARNFGAPAVNSWERSYSVAECGLCGGTVGAFRKSTDGQWIHAFCAEWVLESTFKRGQVNPVEGMETVAKGNDVCLICHRERGVCLKCSYGHCHSSFHPSCARSAGFFMNVRSSCGKLQHKAYCEKHSLEQRTKADSQKHGLEELKCLKQVRVELERLRLLCERIIKREKLKRELVLCSRDILASNRDSVAYSALVCSSFFPPDVSSESATTSLKAYTDDCKSGGEAMQRSDDLTVDSTVAGKRRIRFPVPMDNDQKTDDSSTSQHVYSQKPTERALFAGKQITHRPSAAYRNFSGDGEKRSRYRKHTETFEKELIMTSDQACMKNQRLPKGFVYVPIRCLSKEKGTVSDASHQEPLEHDG